MYYYSIHIGKDGMIHSLGRRKGFTVLYCNIAEYNSLFIAHSIALLSSLVKSICTFNEPCKKRDEVVRSIEDQSDAEMYFD